MIESEANLLLNTFGEYWLKSNPKTQYIAVIQNKENTSLYNLEKGILGVDNILTTSIISKDEMPLLCTFKPEKLMLINSFNSTNKYKSEDKVTSTTESVNLIKPQNISEHKIRPMVGGCCIQSHSNTLILNTESITGTLGAFLKFKDDDSVYIISNFHVLSKKNLIYKDLVFQPEIGKTKDYSNAIGHLIFGHYGDSFNKKHSLDVAFVKLFKRNLLIDNALQINTIKSKGFIWNTNKELDKKNKILEGIKSPKINTAVRIYGSTSGLRKGIIRSTNAWVKVKNAYKGSKTILFKNQILTTCLSNKGDSGSVLIDSNNYVVGLVHAGDDKNVSIANNINHIFKHKYKINGVHNYSINFDKFLT